MNQKRTVMGALDYSLHYLNNMKKELMDLGSGKQEMAWAIGGVIIILTANLLKICQETIELNEDIPNPSAVNDLNRIRDEFNQVIDDMLK